MNWPSWLPLPELPLWSMLALLCAALAALYLVRTPSRRLILYISGAIHGHLRFAARWLVSAATELRERNRSVLLAHGRDELSERVERQSERIETVVRRDLQGYPALQRKLLDRIRVLDEDYRRTADAPPAAPEWTKVANAIARAKLNGDPVVDRIVTDLQRTVREAHDQAMREYAKAFASRHRALGHLQPDVRALGRAISRLDTNMTDLLVRGAEIDRLVLRYTEMHQRTDKAERALTKSAAIQLALATLILLGAAGGVALNFTLIALPLSEIVDNNRFVFGFPMADVGALALITLEAVMGLMLTEALRLTHLIPRLSYLGERARHKLALIALVFLALFAGVEVVLALVHNNVAALDPMINSSLLITRLDVMIVDVWLGLLLPFALAFVAIPLESLLFSVRAVTGAALVLALHALALILRSVGNLTRLAGLLCVKFYDFVIFVPLAVDRAVRARVTSSAATRSESVTRN